MPKITTGKTPNARKTVKITTGITANTRKMAIFTTGKSLNAGVIASRGFSLNLRDEKIYPGIWLCF
ncbi:MAG: hypothetical protein V4560_01505 [Bacteroidota bacterium]